MQEAHDRVRHAVWQDSWGAFLLVLNVLTILTIACTKGLAQLRSVIEDRRPEIAGTPGYRNMVTLLMLRVVATVIVIVIPAAAFSALLSASVGERC